MINAQFPIYILWDTGVIKEIKGQLIADENGVLQFFTIPEQPNPYLILCYSQYLIQDGYLVEMSDFMNNNSIDQNLDTLIFDFLTPTEKTISGHTWFGNVVTSTMTKDLSLFRTDIETQVVYKYSAPPVPEEPPLLRMYNPLSTDNVLTLGVANNEYVKLVALSDFDLSLIPNQVFEVDTVSAAPGVYEIKQESPNQFKVELFEPHVNYEVIFNVTHPATATVEQLKVYVSLE